MYQIKLNKIGLMKLFLRGDEDAEGLITPENFSEIISSFEEKTAVAIIESLGKGMSALFNAVLVAIGFLALLFGFYFLVLAHSVNLGHLMQQLAAHYFSVSETQWEKMMMMMTMTKVMMMMERAMR